MNANEQTYIDVCRLHFRNEASTTDIILIVGVKRLMSYQHETNTGLQTFNNAEQVITTIINCELKAQTLAKSFEFDYEYEQEQLNQKFAS